MNRKELIENIKRKKSFLCVGLDPDLAKFPEHLRDKENAVFEFNKAIIDATAPFAVAYKPNLAFYECLGIDGLKAFGDTIEYLRKNYPDQFIIADAKRGDIGNTSRMYAKTFFNHYNVDALTVAPYMGEDSVSPFLEYEDKWVILLALTSNKGSADFQMISDKEGNFIFEDVMRRSHEWENSDRIMYVVGATHGELLSKARACAPHSFLLVPGIGAQGGSLDEVVKYGMTDECDLLINSSRGIIYASKGYDFAEAAAAEAKNIASQMADQLKSKSII